MKRSHKGRLHREHASGPTSRGRDDWVVDSVKANPTVKPCVQILLIRVLQSSRLFYLLQTETLHTKRRTVPSNQNISTHSHLDPMTLLVSWQIAHWLELEKLWVISSLLNPISQKKKIESNESTQNFTSRDVKFSFTTTLLVLLHRTTPNRVLCCSTEPSKIISMILLWLSLLPSSRCQGTQTSNGIHRCPTLLEQQQPVWLSPDNFHTCARENYIFFTVSMTRHR